MHPGQSQYGEVIARFLAAFSDQRPWYLLLNKVGMANDGTSMVFQVMGLTHTCGVALCKDVGLVAIQIVKGNLVMQVEHEQWWAFLQDSGLTSSTAYNPTELNKKNCVFINLCNTNIQPRDLYYYPQQQCKKAPPMPDYRLYVQQRQLAPTIKRLARYYNCYDMLPKHREVAFTVVSRNSPSEYDDRRDSNNECDDDEEEAGSDTDANVKCQMQ
jgi:hypothetical protein